MGRGRSGMYDFIVMIYEIGLACTDSWNKGVGLACTSDFFHYMYIFLNLTEMNISFTTGYICLCFHIRFHFHTIYIYLLDAPDMSYGGGGVVKEGRL